MSSAILYQITKSEKPIYAPMDYSKRSAVEVFESKFDEVYIGSGIKLQDHPLFKSAIFFETDSFSCAKCRSINNLCIYFSFYSDNVSKVATVELECYDCHYFSQFEFKD